MGGWPDPVPLTCDIGGLALLFIASGTTHVRPQVFEPIVRSGARTV